MKMKQFNKIYAVSAAAVILYAWLLGVAGIFGNEVAEFTRFLSVFILKWSAIVFGLALAIFLPIRVNSALTRNKEKNEEAKRAYEETLATLREQERVRKMREEEKLKTAIAKRVEEENAYEQ